MSLFDFGEIFSDDDDDDDDESEGGVEGKDGELKMNVERNILERERRTEMFRDFDRNLDSVTSQAKELERLFKRALNVTKNGADTIHKQMERKVT